LAEQYRLDESLGKEGRGEFFRAAFAGGRAIVQITRESPGDLWWRAAQLDHPNIQRVLDTGMANGVFYAVYECPDDCLTSALAAGLGQREALAVVAAVGRALAYLHARGFAHGAVNADHIVAVGDTIKLESGTLRDASPPEQAEDLLGLDQLAAFLRVPQEGMRRASRRPWIIAASAVVTVAAIVALTRNPAPPSAPRPVPHVMPAAPVPAVATPNWRVIAYTYIRYHDAETRARYINEKHPGLHAEVFSPNGPNRGPFLVALGGRVTREEAERIEKTAKADGLPRDTFARNY